MTQDRPDVAAARMKLKAEQPKLRAPRLVFIDETAVTTKILNQLFIGLGIDLKTPISFRTNHRNFCREC